MIKFGISLFISVAVLVSFQTKAAVQEKLTIIELLTNLNNGNPKKEIQAIRIIGQNPYQELLQQVIFKLESELNKILLPPPQGSNVDVLLACLDAIANLGNQPVLGDITRLRNFAKQYTYPTLTGRSDMVILNKLDGGFVGAYSKSSLRQKNLPSLYQHVLETDGLAVAEQVKTLLVPNPSNIPIINGGVRSGVPVMDPQVENGYKRDLEDIPKIKAFLESRIKGQPEVIETFLALEMRNHVYAGQRTAPEPIVLMGLKGSGKDTSFETYTDAINGFKKGSYDEHMFSLPIMKSDADLWSVIGSATGYLGSKGISPFIRWLVNHAAGRYLVIEATTEEPAHIIEDPEWVPGTVSPGKFSPEQGVLFANEFHNWSKEIKDTFLKVALEKGYFQINNPGNGVGRLFVPVTIGFATNEGTALLTSRELNGERFGPPLTFEQMMEKWNEVHNDIPRLRSELGRTAGAVNSRASVQHPPGTSEEFSNRLPDRAFCLMRPLSVEDLKDIVRVKFEDWREKLQKAKSGYNIDIQWTNELVDFVQSYEYEAEDNARPISNKIINLVERTILDAIKEKSIVKSQTKQTIKLDIQKNTDKSYNLVVGGSVSLNLAIKQTASQREPVPPTDEQLEKVFDFSKRVKKRVFGIDAIADDIGQAILINQEGRNGVIAEKDAVLPARVFFFLGPSSTGKTELAKAIARELFGNESAMKTFNFGEVRTVQDLQVKILGLRDGLGNPIPSDFMKEYDRANGRIIFNLDELANAPREVLKALYDILREPVVRTFADGKPRVMSQVLIIGTGNASEEWYAKIPRDIPRVEQLAAMEEVYKHAMRDPDYRRGFLEQFFSEALLNRVGEKNIFFFAPLGFKAIRQLAQLKLDLVLNMFKPKPGYRDWDIKFLNRDEYQKAVDVVETEGFVLREQGASIDRFLKQDFYEALRNTLLRGLVPAGKKVALYQIGQTEGNIKDGTTGEVLYGVLVEGESVPLTFKLKRIDVTKHAEISMAEQVFTAFHEAGHELVRHVLFPGKYETEMLSIIPGVGLINNEWIRYLGVVSYNDLQYTSVTREVAIRQIAALEAGFVAQTLVSKGARHDAGKGNDLERGTAFAERAVLVWGLSKAWGVTSVPSGQDIHAYIASLSQERRELFERERDKMLDEGRSLAKTLLLANYDKVFIPLGIEVAEKGILYTDDLKKFYEEHKEDIYIEGEGTIATQFKNTSWTSLLARISPYIYRNVNRDADLLPGLEVPTVVDPAVLLAAKKANQLATIPAQEKLPVWEDTAIFKTGLHNVPAQVETVAEQTGKSVTRQPSSPTSCNALLK